METTPPPNEPTQSPFRIRAKLALLAALCSAITCTIAAYRVSFEPVSNVREKQRVTWSRFEDLRYSVKKFQEKRDRLPEDLLELFTVQQIEGPTRERMRNDLWGRPILYENHGDGWTVRSDGADGKPGGVGLDCDLVFDSRTMEHAYRNNLPAESVPTRQQVLTSEEIKKVPVTAVLLSGLPNFLIAFLLLLAYTPKPEDRLLRLVFGYYGLLLLFCLYIGYMHGTAFFVRPL